MAGRLLSPFALDLQFDDLRIRFEVTVIFGIVLDLQRVQVLQRLYHEVSDPQVVHQGDTEIDRQSADCVVELIFLGVGEVEDDGHFLGLDHVDDLVIRADHVYGRGHKQVGELGFDNKLLGMYVVSHIDESQERLGELFGNVSGNQDVPDLRHLEVGRNGQVSLQESLVLVTTEASDFSGGSHLYTEDGVGTMDSLEGELGSLATNVVQRTSAERVGFNVGLSEENLSGSSNEIDIVDLRNEGEGPRGAQVALDDQNVVALPQVLYIHRAGGLEGRGDNGTDFADPVCDIGRYRVRRAEHGGVTGMDTSVFDVFGDGPVDDGTILGNNVQLNFFGTQKELGHDDRVFRGNVSSVGEEGT